MPIIGVSVAYWQNVHSGVLPECQPLLEGCVSISAAGRYLPGSIPFRAVLLPHAAFLVILWVLACDWLKQLTPSAHSARIILTSGIVGAIALVIYVAFLGTRQPFYEFMRHFGVYFYFFGTAIAQIVMTISMPKSRLQTGMLWVVITPFVLGLINWAQNLWLGDSDTIQNRIEWVSAVLMQVWFVLLFLAWRSSAIAITVRTGPPKLG